MMKEVSVDEKLLKEVIDNENAEISELEVKDFVEAGKNFSGIMRSAKFSAKANGEERAYDIVFKFARNVVNPYIDLGAILFHKEISFYRKFIPCIENWQKEKCGSIKIPIPAPNSLFGCLERRLLVLDNLKQYGFKNALKRYGLNFERCCLTIERIAAFHALGVAFVQDYGESSFISDFDYLQDKFLTIFENEAMVSYMRDMDAKMLDSVSRLLTTAYPEEASDVKDMIKYGKKHHVPNNIKKYLLPNAKLNVIGHGSLWLDNIMFKFDELEKPADVIFVDYQTVRYSTPASDLIYFIWMSADKDVLVNKQDEILEIYHRTLKSELQMLNIELFYTLDDLKEDYYSLIDFGIVQCLKTSLLSDATNEDSFHLDEAENTISEKSLTGLVDKVDQLANVASEVVKDKLINIVRYGKQMKLY